MFIKIKCDFNNLVRLETHSIEISSLIKEKDAAVLQANSFLERTSLIRSLSAELNKKIMNIKSIEQQQKRIKEECNSSNYKTKRIKTKMNANVPYIIERQRILLLHNKIREKKKLLEESLKRKSQFDNYQPDNNPALKSWQRTHKMTVGTRRILVKEITSLFELKPGFIEEPETPSIQQQQQYIGDKPAFSNKLSMQTEEGIEDLYICGVSLPTRLIDVSSKT
jgi:hypothetical protein